MKLTTKMKLTENELLSLVTILWKRNEEIENYELSNLQGHYGEL